VIGVTHPTEPSGTIGFDTTTTQTDFSSIHLAEKIFIRGNQPIQIKTEQLSPARRTPDRRVFYSFVKVVDVHERALAGISMCDTPRLMP